MMDARRSSTSQFPGTQLGIIPWDPEIGNTKLLDTTDLREPFLDKLASYSENLSRDRNAISLLW